MPTASTMTEASAKPDWATPIASYAGASFACSSVDSK